MLVILDAGQLLRHKYGGFYRFVSYAEDHSKIVLKHVWSFEEANQIRATKDLLKFQECAEQQLKDIMSSCTAEEYQEVVAYNKAHK